MAPALLRRVNSALVVIDAQERLLPVMKERKALVPRLGALLDAARLLGVPAVFTEHCAEAIGPVDGDLKRRAPDATVLAKRVFRSTAEPEFTSHLVNLGRDQIVIAGVEAHVCVLQTALDLLDRGYEVFVVADAVGTRMEPDRTLALQRMTGAGVVAVSTEMVLFEWCETGDHPAFAKLLPIIKDLAAKA